MHIVSMKILHLPAHITFYYLYKSKIRNQKLEIIMKGACRSSLVAYVRKCSGSHRKVRPAGAEYQLNDGLLRNEAAHNGRP